MRKLKGKEKQMAQENLDFLAQFGVSGIQMGSKRIRRKGNAIVEEKARQENKVKNYRATVRTPHRAR